MQSIAKFWIMVALCSSYVFAQNGTVQKYPPPASGSSIPTPVSVANGGTGNTVGNAVTASALATAGTPCPTGTYASGVDAAGNGICNPLPAQSAQNQYIAPQAVSGCGVEYVSGLTYTVGACSYSINGVNYSSPLTTITLPTADPTNPEIDVLFVDTTQVVQVIQGTPAATPQQPVVDPSTQLELTFVLVPAESTTPANTTLVDIYLEGSEWTTAKGGTNSSRVNATSTNNPYQGTYDTEFGNGGTVTTTTYVGYTDPAAGTVTLSNYNNLVFYFRNKAAWPTTRSVVVQWYNGTTAKGTPIVLSNGAYGINSTTNTTTYQQISIPTAVFGLAGIPVTSVRFTVGGTGTALTGFYLDEITLQGGTGTLVLPNTLMNFKGTYSSTASYATNDLVVNSGNAFVAILPNTNVATSNTTYWTPIGTSITTPVSVANGGTGATTGTGYAYGNGTSAFSFSTSIPYGSLSGTPTIPTTSSWPNAGACTTNQYVNALVNGSVPTCSLVSYTQISGTPTLAQAISSVSHEWLVSYNASTGAFAQSQPAFGDISGQLTNSQLANQTANTVLGATSATYPSGLAMPSCSGASNALSWTTGTGFGCNTITASGLAFPVTVSGTATSGGIPYFSNTTTLTTSALLAQHALMVGGGAGAAPATLSVGGANFPLIGQSSANPTWSTISYPSSMTSGGIPYASSSTALTTSAALTQYGVVLGGGAGGSPTSTAAGGANFPLIGQSSANPTWSTITYPSSATSGGIPYYSSSTATTSSAALTHYGVIYGGGAGGAPVATAADTTASHALFATATAPAFRAIGVSDWVFTNYVSGGGTGQAQTVTLSTSPGSYTAGLEVKWLPTAANTVAGPTLNVNSLGNKTITKCGTVALIASDLTTTTIAIAIYDGTEFQLINPQAAACGVTGAPGSTGQTLYNNSSAIAADTGSTTDGAGNVVHGTVSVTGSGEGASASKVSVIYNSGTGGLVAFGANTSTVGEVALEGNVSDGSDAWLYQLCQPGSCRVYTGLNISEVFFNGNVFTPSGSCGVYNDRGGASGGDFQSGVTGTCTVTITMGDSESATFGHSCWANDLTTPADSIKQTAMTSTTVTLSGTTVSGDLINFGCVGY